jgi:prophage tail gpP-like protein
MAKQIISAQELSRLIKQEMKKHRDCAATLRLEVFWHPEQEHCKWDVDILSDSITEAETCDECIHSVVQVLQTRYYLAKVS